MWKALFLLLVPQFLFSQEVKITVIDEKPAAEDLIEQIINLTIYNNNIDPICIRISPSFLVYDLSRDTVELTRFDGNGCFRYDLYNTARGDSGIFENGPRFPLILNGKTSFNANLKVMKKKSCNDRWLEFHYFELDEYYYNILFKKYFDRQPWDIDGKFKYKTMKLLF